MLDKFFSPRSIAVIGASNDKKKLGFQIMKNILDAQFPAKGGLRKWPVFPINPKSSKILSRRVYKSVLDVRRKIDLAVIVVPASLVRSVIEECGRKGVKSVIVVSAGFRETHGKYTESDTEKNTEEELVRICEEYGMSLLGPNCLGIIDTESKLNASFAPSFPEKGEVGFVSQSGAMCTAMLDWAKNKSFGFSKFVSVGNEAGVDAVDMIYHLGKDKNTKVILVYLEEIKDGKKFMKLIPKVTRKKPVIILKSGTSVFGQRAASTHTGAMISSEDAVDAAFRAAGVTRVKTIEELFDFALAFAYQPLPKGKRVGVITNAGGPGVITADAISQRGLELAKFGRLTQSVLNLSIYSRPDGKVVPTGVVSNPLDVIGDARSDRYGKALNALIKDKNVDCLLIILTAQSVTDVEHVAEVIASYEYKSKKPFLVSFIGGAAVHKGVKLLRKYHIPVFQYPEEGVKALAGMVHYAELKKRGSGVKKRLKAKRRKDKGRLSKQQRLVQTIFDIAKVEGRDFLLEEEGVEVLRAYGIDYPTLKVCESLKQVEKAVNRMGFPVVLKVVSSEIQHKTEVGGVKVCLESMAEVRSAYREIMRLYKKYMLEGVVVEKMVEHGKEMMIGVKRDDQFGHLVLIGMGGIYTEVFQDVTRLLIPFSKKQLCERLWSLKSVALLMGVRGEKPVDGVAYLDAVMRVQQLVLDFPEISEIDLNPVKVQKKGVKVVDVLIRLG